MPTLPALQKVPWGIGAALVVYLLAWIGSTIFLVVFLRIMALWVPEAGVYLAALGRGEIYSSLSLTVVNALIGLGLVSLYLKHFGATWASVGWRRFNLWQASLYLLGVYLTFAVASGLLFGIVALLFPAFNESQPQVNNFTTSASSHPLLVFIGLVVIPPIIEETVFRGFIFPAFAKKWGTVWGAIISSMMFGLAHLQFNVSLYTFLLGLLLCFLYVRLKSIFPGMFFHMLNNYLALMFMTGK